MELGVQTMSISITENATLGIGLLELTSEKVELLLDTLKGKVPPGILVLYEHGPIFLAAGQDDPFRPVIGGIMETSFRDDLMVWDSATIGFYVTWLSGTRKGVLIAGHMTGEYITDVYQPTYSSQYHIGNMVKWGLGPDADAALIEFDVGISGSPHIWSPNIENMVVGERHYDDMYVGEDIEFTGLTSGIEPCEIKRKGDVGYMRNQVTINYLVQPGDSGSPAYKKYYEPSEKIYTSIAYGVVWGRNPSLNEGYFSPVDGIETQLGYNLNFAG